MMNNSKISEFKFKKSKNVYTVIFLASLILYSIFAYSAKFILDTKKNMSISNYVVEYSTNGISRSSFAGFIYIGYVCLYFYFYILYCYKDKKRNT